MTLNYQNVWESLNELEMITSKVCSAREILDCAIEALESGNREKAETLMYATDEFLQYYLKDFDEKFKVAWKETVTKLKYQEYDAVYNPEEYEKDKVKRWVLPVQEIENGDTMETEYFITLPDDLLDQTGWKENDDLNWDDNGDGTFTLTKSTKLQ